jgi:hypothetical protein
MLDEVQQTTSMRNMKIDQVSKKSQGESLIYWGDYLYVKNCMRNWEIWAICTCPPTGVTIQDNENLSNNEKQSSATLPGSFQVPGSGDPFFSFLSVHDLAPFFSVLAPFLCWSESWPIADLGFWAGRVLCFQELDVLPWDANERTRIINVPLQYLPLRQRISIQRGSRSSDVERSTAEGRWRFSFVRSHPTAERSILQFLETKRTSGPKGQFSKY